MYLYAHIMSMCASVYMCVHMYVFVCICFFVCVHIYICVHVNYIIFTMAEQIHPLPLKDEQILLKLHM